MAADSNAQRLAGSCNDSPPSQLSIGSTARVTDYGNPLGPYSSKTVAEGTLMTLILGPICENHGDLGWAWIANTSNETGIWVYENNAGGYFLEPAETIKAGQANANQPSATPVEGRDCPGAEPQRVIIGDSIRVCTKSDRLTVREQPSLDSTIQIRIYPGTIAQVIEGPSCADNSSWWKVKVAAGTRGTQNE